MKKIVNILVLIAFSCQFIFGEVLFNIDPANSTENIIAKKGMKNLEEKWTAAGIVPALLATSRSFTYGNENGMKSTALNIVPEIQTLIKAGNTDIILSGFSQGGLVARQVLQELPEADRAKVKGIITLGTPQTGSRLADQGWAWWSAACIGGYATATAFYLAAPIYCQFAGIFEVPATAQKKLETAIIGNELDPLMNSRIQAIQESLAKMRDARTAGRLRGRPLTEVGLDYGLPLIDTLMGDNLGDDNRGSLNLFLSALFAGENHSVRQLNPASGFLANLNSDTSVRTEKTVKRAAIMNRNGDMYDTTMWPTVEFFLSVYRGLSTTYLALAARNWYRPRVAFGYVYSAASTEMSRLMLANANSMVSYIHTGEWGNHTDHEILVPYSDTFNGFTLNERLQKGDIASGKDKEYTNDKVCHIDVATKLAELQSGRGKNGSKSGAATQLVSSLKDSYIFMMSK